MCVLGLLLDVAQQTITAIESTTHVDLWLFKRSGSELNNGFGMLLREQQLVEVRKLFTEISGGRRLLLLRGVEVGDHLGDVGNREVLIPIGSRSRLHVVEGKAYVQTFTDTLDEVGVKVVLTRDLLQGVGGGGTAVDVGHSLIQCGLDQCHRSLHGRIMSGMGLAFNRLLDV